MKLPIYIYTDEDGITATRLSRDEELDKLIEDGYAVSRTIVHAHYLEVTDSSGLRTELNSDLPE